MKPVSIVKEDMGEGHILCEKGFISSNKTSKVWWRCARVSF